MMNEFAIELDNVTKSFRMDENHLSNKLNLGKASHAKTIVALDKVSFQINKGETIGIIGLNGSGKTTLLRIIAGIYYPDFGKVKTSGLIAPLLQIGSGFQNDLVARENIILYGMLLGISKSKIKSKVDEIIRFAELENFSNLRLKHYSAGMRARLAFSTALQVDPDILLVDEILSVGDASFQEKSFNAFLSFKQNHKTILYTTHNMGMISKLSDRVMLIDKGKLIIFGKKEEVISKYKEIIKSVANLTRE